MRVALVHPYLWPEVRRGAERYVDDLSRYLCGRGHDVFVVSATDGQTHEARRHDGGVDLRVRRRRVRGARRLGLGEVETFGVDALGALRRVRPDVVHAMVPSAALAGRIAHRPTLYTVLGHPTRDQLPAQRLPRWLFGSAVRGATAVLSNASAKALQGTFGRSARVLPPGIHMDHFVSNDAGRSGPPVILFSASLADPRKRARLAVDAFGVFLDTHPGARLMLSGQGDPEPVLAGVPDHVRAAVDTPGAGSPDDVAQRYRAATVTLLPSEHEAFGLALVESLACGTPVVCAPGGGMPEIVVPGTGAVAAAWTPAAVADALRTAVAMASDPSTPRSCTARAQDFDWGSSVGPAHESAYAELLAGR
ncbi:MAG: glycosyltransferase family 4 protein [Acidimicrobiales bacterium]